MILEKVHIHGFRSIQEPLDLWINPRLSILVGANEHGKSNLLDSISFLGKSDFASDDKCRSRNFNAGEDKVPQINFSLLLNRDEKEALSEHLSEIQTAVPAEKDEPTKQLLSKIEKVLDDLKKNESPKLEVSVHEGYIKTFFYILKNGTRIILNSTHFLNAPTAVFMEGLLPKVVSFAPDIDFPNSITLAELNSRNSKEWEGLLKLGSGVWEEKEKLFQNSLDGRDFREASKNKIQRKLRTIWSQGKQDEADLKIDLQLDTITGKLLLDFIDRTGTRNQPSHRSLGFKSFFSFYLRLYAETTEIDPHGYIFSFDEPGLHLHPSGQKDLLREIRKISENNQIIFSTHSPFLIDRHTSTKVVVVSKDQGGTKVDQKPYRKNWAPLKSSLGLVMSDTFFYADKTLLVEGTSDRIFIASLLQKFADDLEIDINFLSVIDGDDRLILPSIARILLAEDREIVLLTDKDKGGEDLIKLVSDLAKSMRKTSIFKSQHFGNIISQQGNISIEDVLPQVPLETAIKKYLKDILGVEESFSLKDVNKNGLTLGKALTDHFLAKGWTTPTSNFSKTTVADFFAQNLVEFKDPIAEEHPSKALCKKLKDLLDLK